ncbi:MAG: hypothetical protein KJ955_04940 [Nanoarchaeota archaeon]|nr:hypothetical protein [Nanoarchaeota archaeon]
MAAALTALQNYKAMDEDLQRVDVLREFQAIYNNDTKAAELAVNRIARNESRDALPATRVVRELEFLLTCRGEGKTLLDG